MELKTYFAQDASGNIMPGASVTVYLANTTTLATGLQDESGSPLSNPFTADSSAKVAFYAPDGLYDITVVGNGRTVTIRAQFVSVDLASVLRSDLSAPGGSALVGFQRSGSGAVPRTARDKFLELPYASDFGADTTGANGCADAIESMIDEGFFCFSQGTYLIEREVQVDISTVNNVQIDSGVIFRVTGDNNAFSFRNIDKNLDFNSAKLRIEKDGYSGLGIKFGGRDSIWPTAIPEWEHLYIGNICADYTVWSPAAGFSTNRAGTAFAIHSDNPVGTNGAPHVFETYDLSARNFDAALQMKCDGHPDNFMSTLTVNLHSWWCKKVVVDASAETAAPIDDCEFNLVVQPSTDFQKILKINTGSGKIVRSKINYHLWDDQVISDTSALIDARDSNTYNASLLETTGNPVTKILNFVSVNGATPVKSYSSRLTDGNRPVYADARQIQLIMKGCDLNTTTEVTEVTVTNGGEGYATAPTVKIAGAGAGARATATITDGAVTGVTVTNGGAGYAGAVTVSFSGGGGSGATATATTSGASMTVNKACQLIKANVDVMKFRHNFRIDFSAYNGANPTAVTAFFKHFYNAWQPFVDSGGRGRWIVDVEWLSGEVQLVSVDYTRRISDHQITTHIQLDYSNYQNTTYAIAWALAPTTRANIGTITSKFACPIGYGPVFDTTSGKPLWYAGGTAWKDAVGTVVP